MTWHKKGTGSTAKPGAKPKAPTVPKPPAPAAPTAPKPAKSSTPKAAPAAKPTHMHGGSKGGKTGVYAAKQPHFGGKHSPVKTGHIH